MSIARQFLLTLENKPGVLAAVCSQLAAKAVNIQAISVEVGTGFSAVRLVVNQPVTARKVFAEFDIHFAEDDVLVARLSNRPGALGRITRKLAEHSINIEFVYGTIIQGSPRALLVLGVSNLKKAAGLIK